jgi:hypothetical protein
VAKVGRIVRAAVAILLLSALSYVLIIRAHGTDALIKEEFAKIPDLACALVLGLGLFGLFVILRHPARNFGRRAAAFAVYLWGDQEQSPYYGLEPKERLDLANALRSQRIQVITTVIQSLGGIALLIGIYFAWANLRTTQEAQKATQQNQAETLRITNEGQITERFTRAIDQLGSPQLELRLGGIYGLESIANESPTYHWPIMEVLTAYVRVHSPAKDTKVKYSGSAATHREPISITPSTPVPLAPTQIFKRSFLSLAAGNGVSRMEKTNIWTFRIRG